MLQLYKYLYYRLYSWNLKKWGEIDGPQYNALLGTTFMMLLNLSLPLVILDSIELIEIFGTKEKPIDEILIIIFSLLGINYFWLVYNYKYLDLEKKYKHESKQKRVKNALFLWVYAILSFGVFILLVSL